MNLKILQSREVALISEFLFDLYQPVTAKEFGKHVVALGRRHFTSHFSAFDEMEMATGAYAACVEHPLPCSDEHCGIALASDPAFQYATNGGRERVLMITDFASQRQYRETPMYREVLRPWGGGYRLSLTIPTRTHMCALHLHRDRPIHEEMRAVLALLAPHVERAHTLAQQRGEPSEMLRRLNPAALGLTPREAEVLFWIAEGKRDAEIAIILEVAYRTVCKNVERILRKLNVETRTAAVAAALSMCKNS